METPARHNRNVFSFGRNSLHPPTDILVVCTGNICRSPYIAALLSAGLPKLIVRSAGSVALPGEMPVHEILGLLAARHIVQPREPSQTLTRGMVQSARLIITATRLHRAKVVAMDPTAAVRAFTLKELARVTDIGTPAGGFDAVVDRAAALAQTLETVDHDDDLADPIGLLPPAYEQMADEVDAALRVLLPALRG